MSPERLRAWERRYGLLAPQRTEGDQRLYTEEDVVAVRAVLALVAHGWTVKAAAASVAEQRLQGSPASGTSGEARGEIPLGEGAGPGGAQRRRASTGAAILRRADEAADVETLITVHETTRAILRAATPREVTAALTRLVERLGGHTGRATVQDDTVIPLDINFADGEPLMPYAPPFSLARMRLEAVLPALVEDARLAVSRLDPGPA